MLTLANYMLRSADFIGLTVLAAILTSAVFIVG